MFYQKMNYSINSPLRNKVIINGRVIGPGLLLEKESRGKTSLFSFRNDPVSAYSERTENGMDSNGNHKTTVLITTWYRVWKFMVC